MCTKQQLSSGSLSILLSLRILPQQVSLSNIRRMNCSKVTVDGKTKNTEVEFGIEFGIMAQGGRFANRLPGSRLHAPGSEAARSLNQGPLVSRSSLSATLQRLSSNCSPPFPEYLKKLAVASFLDRAPDDRYQNRDRGSTASYENLPVAL